MKLLFDENLSSSLADALEDVFPGSVGSREAGLGGASDMRVLDFATANGFVVVTKDSDLFDLSLIGRVQCKVVRITLGNCSTASVLILLRNTVDIVRDFASSEDSVLELP